jgi:hypothetical protein
MLVGRAYRGTGRDCVLPGLRGVDDVVFSGGLMIAAVTGGQTTSLRMRY